MKKFIFWALLLLWALPVGATEITVSSLNLPNGNLTGIGTAVTATVTVTNGSANVTCSACLPTRYVGMMGWQVALSGIYYTVATADSASAFTLSTNYAGASGSTTATIPPIIELRIYTSQPYQPLGASYIVQSGAPGTGNFFKRYACSVRQIAGVNTIVIPPVTLDATSDAASAADRFARLSAWFHRTDGSRIQAFDGLNGFAVPASPTTTTWATLRIVPEARFPASNLTYSVEQINALLNVDRGISGTYRRLGLIGPTGASIENSAIYQDGSGNIVAENALAVGGAATIGGAVAATGNITTAGDLIGGIPRLAFASFPICSLAIEGRSYKATTMNRDVYDCVREGVTYQWRSRNGGVANVLDFGAVSNVNTDQTAKVQAAFDSGFDVLIPGTLADYYRIDGTLTINTERQRITNHATLKRVAAAASGAPIVRFNFQHAVFEGGQLLSEKNTTPGIVCFGAPNPASDSQGNVLWNRLTGVLVGGDSAAASRGITFRSVESYGGSQATYANFVDNCTVENVGVGVYFGGQANGNIVTNTHFFGIGDQAIHLNGDDATSAPGVSDNVVVGTFVHFSAGLNQIILANRATFNEFSAIHGEPGAGQVAYLDANTLNNKIIGIDNCPSGSTDLGTANILFLNNQISQVNINSVASTPERLNVNGNAYLSGAFPYLDLYSTGWSQHSYIQANVTLSGTGTGDYLMVQVPSNRGFSINMGASTSRFAIAPTTGAVAVNNVASSAFSVGQAASPTFLVDAGIGASQTGVKVSTASAGSGVAIGAISSGPNETITISGKGTGIAAIGDTGTATASAGAVTLNTQRGTITSESLTTAAGASYTLTLTSSKITTASVVFLNVYNGTNNQGTFGYPVATPGSGSVTIAVPNIHASAAFNGTIKINFLVQ